MSVNTYTKYACSVALFVIFQLLNQVAAELCINSGKRCYAPYQCCGNECCVDEDRHETRYYYRWNIWNMWYFWFVLIFILMSCFGGCGYYRRRQVIMSRRSHLGGHDSTSHLSTHRPRPHGSMSHAAPSVAVPVYPNMFAYNGPATPAYNPPIMPDTYTLGAPTHTIGQFYQTNNMPPAYSEVMSKPEAYPISKDDLPAYPGLQYTGGEIPTILPPSMTGAMPEPPPYNASLQPVSHDQSHDQPSSHDQAESHDQPTTHPAAPSSSDTSTA